MDTEVEKQIDEAAKEVGDIKATEGEEKLSAIDMMKAFKNMDVDDNKSLLGMTIETMNMADGKTKKGDIYMSTFNGALAALKQLIEMSIEVATKKQEKKKKKKKDKDEDPTKKWKFETAPLKQFDKTLDDLYTTFLIWGKENGPKEDKKANAQSESKDKTFNVSKAFRRLESYADWMHDTGTDLTVPELTVSGMKNAHNIWKMKASVDKEGHFVWWIDIGSIDLKELKALSTEESLRYFVWYCHFIMFDENAQQKGIVLVENIDKLGFWTSLTLMPPKLSAKLDRLTIGVLPVKIKQIYLLETSAWLKVFMALVSPFMSKKMKSRMTDLDKDYATLCEALGGPEYSFEGFGKLSNGGLKKDLNEKYFS